MVIDTRRDTMKNEVQRIGKKPDHKRWNDMMPQTVNACFIPELNEIVIPAAILRPPIFDPSLEDAYNYGALGAVIGHELSHAFDPNGMRFNESGKLVRVDTAWYDPLRAAVDAQATALGENAKLTSSENVADVAGLHFAMEALKSREGYDEKNNHIFFERWATVWASKFTERDAKRRSLVDPHPNGRDRSRLGPANEDEFIKAFNVKAGDAMYPKGPVARMWW